MVEVLATDPFRDWYFELSDADADAVTLSVERLEQLGVALPFPYSSKVEGSRYALRELRIAAGRSPIRVFYAFDPRRNAVLLLGGSKAGTKRFYKEQIPPAERIWERYLEELEEPR
jgi:hypothetical protein